MADMPANGSETVFVYASVVDAHGTVAPTASDKVTFAVTGPAELASPPTANAEAGIATALVRVSDQPGQVTVTATAPGMEGGQACITTR